MTSATSFPLLFFSLFLPCGQGQQTGESCLLFLLDRGDRQEIFSFIIMSSL